MKHTTRTLTAMLVLLAILCSVMTSCFSSPSGSQIPGGGEQTPKSALELTYTVEGGKNVLTVSSAEDSTIYEGFLNQSDNTTVGDAVSAADIQVLRIGEGVVYLEQTSDLTALETVDIIDGEELTIDGYAFFYNTQLKLLLIGGTAPALKDEFLRLPQDRVMSVEYKDGATPYKTKYLYGGHPVKFESNAAIPDMTLEDYALETVREAKLLAKKIFERYTGSKDFLYMPYSQEISDWAKIKEFTLELTENATTDEEKIEVIYDYIVENITYSDYALDYAPYRVLTEGVAVCAGYVGLMHDMLASVGIASFYTNGFTLTTPNLTVEMAISGRKNIDEGHAVLAVLSAAGEVSFYDPTNGAVFPDASKNMTDEALAARMLIAEVESLEVMIEGVDFTLYTDSGIEFLAEDGYIYTAHDGEFFYNIGSTGDVRNYWLSQRVSCATDGDNVYADGSLQPAGTVFTEGLLIDDGVNPVFALANGHVIRAEAAFAFAQLENEVYGKNISLPLGRLIAEDGVLYLAGEADSGTCLAVGYYGTSGDVVIPATVQGKTVRGIDHSAFTFAKFESLTVSEGIGFLYEWALDNCFNLEYLSLPASLVPGTPNGPDEIWPLKFNGLTSLREINVADDNPYLTVVDGVLYDKEMTTIICYPAMKEGDSFTIPESVKTIGARAFAHTQLTEVVFNEGLETVCTEAFAYSHIKDVTLLNGVNYESGVFWYSCLESVSFEEGITEIPSYTFYGCQSLQEVNFPTTLNKIGAVSFSLCTAIYKMEIPEGVEVIEKFAFSSAAKLVELTLPETLTEIGEDAFDYCDKLYHVINNSPLQLTAGDVSHGRVAYNALQISSGNADSVLHFTDDGFIFYLSEWGNSLVGYLGDATDLVLPENVLGESYTLAVGAFAGNTEWGMQTTSPDAYYSYSFASSHPTMHIRSVTIPKMITEIPQHAFTGWAALETVYYLGTEEEALDVIVDYSENGNREFGEAEVVYLGE